MSKTNKKFISPFYTPKSKYLFERSWLPLISKPLNKQTLRGFSKKQIFVGITKRKKTIVEKSFVSKNTDNHPPIDKAFPFISQLLPMDKLCAVDKKDMQASKRIKIHPTAEQLNLFNKCFGATRYFYNKTISAIKEAYKKRSRMLKKRKDQKSNKCLANVRINKIKGTKSVKAIGQCCKPIMKGNKFFCKAHTKEEDKYKVPLSFYYWSGKVIIANTNLTEKDIWQKDIPYDTRNLIIKTAVANYKSAMTGLKNGTINKFDIGYMSKKKKKQMFHISNRALKNKELKNFFLWPTYLKDPLKMSKRNSKWVGDYIKNDKLQDMQMVREWPSNYYLIIPFFKEKSTVAPPNRVISIDPGVRTFHTFYDPNGACGKIGDGLASSITKINKRIDKLISITCSKKGRTKRNLKKKCAKLRKKIKNKVRDLHWKTANYYCKNYKNIIIPKLDGVSIAKKKNKYVNRSIKNLAHGEFIEKLKKKSREYDNKIFIVTEAYTSQTCGKCGILNATLGDAKTNKCNSCKEETDRDINAARNIFIKSLRCV